ILITMGYTPVYEDVFESIKHNLIIPMIDPSLIIIDYKMEQKIIEYQMYKYQKIFQHQYSSELLEYICRGDDVYVELLKHICNNGIIFPNRLHLNLIINNNKYYNTGSIKYLITDVGIKIDMIILKNIINKFGNSILNKLVNNMTFDVKPNKKNI